MKTTTANHTIELPKILGIMGVLPPVALLMIVMQWIKGEKITLWSALSFLLGILYTIAIVVQIKMLG